MDLQHINVKIYAATPEAIRLEDVILIYHRWIQEGQLPELLIDVADYSHVPAGPGILLVGHEAHYRVEPGPEQRMGALYDVRVKRDGSNQDKLRHAIGGALRAAAKLEADELWKGKVRFNAGDMLILVNDRLGAPNTDATFAAIQSDVRAAFAAITGAEPAILERVSADPRERLTLRAAAAAEIPVAGALSRV